MGKALGNAVFAHIMIGPHISYPYFGYIILAILCRIVWILSKIAMNGEREYQKAYAANINARNQSLANSIELLRRLQRATCRPVVLSGNAP